MAKKQEAQHTIKNPFEDDGKKSQVFLKVGDAVRDADLCPRLMLRSADEEGYPANLVKLNGVVLEKDPKEKWTEDDAWTVANDIASMCREQAESKDGTPARDAMREHLAYAYSILCDYLRETEGEWLMSKETSETLIRGAIDRIVRAGKCVKFELDQYRSINE